MASEQFVNVSYRGIDVGKSLRMAEFGPSTAYLQVTTPMPVGTQIDIETDGGLRMTARVLRVQEQVAGAEHAPGMRIGVGDVSGDAKAWWQALVDSEDPAIPEPHVVVEALSDDVPEEVAAEAADAPAVASDAASSEPPTGVESPEVEAPSELTAPVPKDGKARTLVMDVSELQAALAAGGDAAAVPTDIDARPTVEMAAVDIAAIEAEMATTEAQTDGVASASGAPEAEGKKKKKRRRRRKK